jgi:hypothetical protein
LCLVILMTSCGVKLDVTPGTKFKCQGAADCPTGFTCATDLGFCVQSLDAVPVLAVSFTLPSDGDTEVSAAPKIIVVFNMDAELPDPSLVTLTLEHTGETVPLTVTASGIANTALITPTQRLVPLTRYRLDIAPGVQPLAGSLAFASQTAWSATFETAKGSDITPPGNVTSFVVERDSGASGAVHKFTWQDPTDDDRAGTLILRSTAPIVDAPAAGASYALDETIGAATVVFVGIQRTGNDTPPAAGPYYYSAFAYDTSRNYSIGVSHPVATIANFLWCPSHTGSFTLASSDGGNGFVQVQSVDTQTYDPSLLIPASPVAFNASTPFGEGGLIVRGTSVYARPIAVSGEGRYVGPTVPWQLPDADLQLTTPTNVQLYLAATSTFLAQTWPSFEAGRDIDPAIGAETWESVTPAAGSVSTTYDVRGVYRLRARPVVAGCADAAFSESNEFTVGGIADLYVFSGGLGQGSGVSPANAAPTIDAANNQASSGTVIHVADGMYPEQLVMKFGVTYQGGWNQTFTTRNAAAGATIIAHPSGVNPLVFAADPAMDTNTVIDGFTIGSADAQLYNVVSTGSGASPLVSNNIIIGGDFGISVSGGAPEFVGNDIRKKVLLQNTNALFLNNTIEAVSDDTSTLVVNCSSASAPTFRGNFIHDTRTSGTGAAIGTFQGCSPVIDSNILVGPSVTAAAVHSTGINIQGSPFSVTIVNNLIYTPSGAGHVNAIELNDISDSSGTASILIANNTIRVGQASSGTSSFGINAHQGPATWNTRVVNNLFFGDPGGSSGWWALAVDSGYALQVLQNNVVLTANQGKLFNNQDVATSEAALCSGAPAIIATSNVAIADSQTAVFADVDGADGNIDTMHDNNWHLLAAANAAVRNGGLTLASTGNDCGGTSNGTTCSATSANFSIACGEVTVDYAGTARTASYSVGAYEQ